MPVWLWFILTLSGSHGTFEDALDEFRIRELIYQAEVFNRNEESLLELRAMLRRTEDPASRAALAKAMAVVKYPSLPLEPFRKEWLDPRAPRAVLLHRNLGYWLHRGTWLETGDWLGDAFIVEILPNALVLESADRGRERLSFPPIGGDETNGCFLDRAGLGALLGFIAKQEGLNSFIPSELDRQMSGFFPIPDWLALVDRLCKEAEISWTRRRDNVVFYPAYAGQAEKIKSLERKNENLAAFLQQIAENFDMELIMDEGIADIGIDIYFQDQPWDEVLDCLAIMNGFTWTLIPHPGEKAKLFIQKE